MANKVKFEIWRETFSKPGFTSNVREGAASIPLLGCEAQTRLTVALHKKPSEMRWDHELEKKEDVKVKSKTYPKQDF